MRPGEDILHDLKKLEPTPEMEALRVLYRQCARNWSQEKLYHWEIAFLTECSKAYPKHKKFFSERRVVLHFYLGTFSRDTFHDRHTIFNFAKQFGEDSIAPVLELLNKGAVNVSAARQLVTQARHAHQISKLPPRTCVDEVCDRLQRDSEGKLIGVWSDASKKEHEEKLLSECEARAETKSAPSEAERAESAPPEVATEKPAKPPRARKRKSQPPPAPESSGANGTSQQHFDIVKIGTEFFGWVDEVTRTIPILDRQQVRSEYQDEFTTLIARLRRKVLHLSRGVILTTRREIEHAFGVLNFPCPNPASPWDLNPVKMSYRRQAAGVHPDRGGDSETFIALTDAYVKLEHLHRQYNGVMP